MVSDVMSAGAHSDATTNVAWSEVNYELAPDAEPIQSFLGMKGKPGISQASLAMIPLTGFFLMLGGTDCLQSILYLLRNPDFYDLTID
jgi:hypothetical protein